MRVGYTDATFKANKAKIKEDFDAAVAKVRGGEFDCLVFPKSGLGTGTANLKRGAPQTNAFFFLTLMYFSVP